MSTQQQINASGYSFSNAVYHSGNAKYYAIEWSGSNAKLWATSADWDSGWSLQATLAIGSTPSQTQTIIITLYGDAILAAINDGTNLKLLTIDVNNSTLSAETIAAAPSPSLSDYKKVHKGSSGSLVVFSTAQVTSMGNNYNNLGYFRKPNGGSWSAWTNCSASVITAVSGAILHTFRKDDDCWAITASNSRYGWVGIESGSKAIAQTSVSLSRPSGLVTHADNASSKYYTANYSSPTITFYSVPMTSNPSGTITVTTISTKSFANLGYLCLRWDNSTSKFHVNYAEKVGTFNYDVYSSGAWAGASAINTGITPNNAFATGSCLVDGDLIESGSITLKMLLAVTSAGTWGIRHIITQAGVTNLTGALSLPFFTLSSSLSVINPKAWQGLQLNSSLEAALIIKDEWRFYSSLNSVLDKIESFTLQLNYSADNTAIETTATIKVPKEVSAKITNAVTDIIGIRLSFGGVDRDIFTGAITNIIAGDTLDVINGFQSSPVTLPKEFQCGKVISYSADSTSKNRVRLPYEYSLNLGDTVKTDLLNIIANRITHYVSLKQQTTEVMDSA